MRLFFTSLKLGCVLLFVVSQANAQTTLSFSLKSDSVAYGTQGSTITIFATLYNLTTNSVNYKVTRLINDWPSAWGDSDNMFCFNGSCYAPTTDTKTQTLSTEDSTLFDTEWITGNSNDTGHILMEFYDLNNSGYKIYQNFYAVINGSSGIADVQVSNNPISIYPNPFTTSTKLSVPSSLLQNNSSLNFMLYDETGRIVKSMPISQSGNLSLERNNLPSGIYFYSVFNSQQTNGSLIQRGKLVIF